MSSCSRGAGTLSAVDVPDRIEVEDGARVTITWDDGAVTELGAGELRAACPCATCREPYGRARTEAVLAGPIEVTITDTRLVGGYALGFVFGPDGHRTGIFPFGLLRSLRRRAQEPDTG